MKVLINIPEDIYNHIVIDSEYFAPSLVNVFKNGTPIHDNATNGDVVKTMFKPNRITRTDDTVYIGYDFTPEWWNTPYYNNK